MNPEAKSRSHRAAVIILAAIACGLAIGSIYASQMSLDAISTEIGVRQDLAGALLAATQIGYACGLLLVVPLGDMVNRRVLLLAQMSALTLGLLLTAFAQVAVALFVGLFFVGGMAVVTQSLVAYVAATSPDDQRGRMVGYLTTGVVTGIVLTRMTSGHLTDLYGWRATYLFLCALCAIVTSALACVLPQDKSVTAPPVYLALLGSLRDLYITEPQLRMRSWMAATTFGAFSAFWTNLVFLASAAPLSLTHTETGLFGLTGLFGALAARIAGPLSDLGRGRSTMNAALLGLSLAWLLIAAGQTSLCMLIAGAVLMDIAIQTVHVTNQTALYNLRPNASGRMVAIYMSFYSVGSCLAALASVWLYARIGWTAVSLLGLALSLIAAVLWLRLTRASSRSRSVDLPVHLP